MKTTIRKWAGKMYAALVQLYDRLTAKKCEISIGDILLKRANIDSCQFTTATRLLDVKHYYETGLSDFPYQNHVSQVMWGKSHDEERGNYSFVQLIKSYEKNGYNQSLLEVSNRFVLLNGTHRVACNVFFKYDYIRVKRLSRSIAINNTPFKQLELDLKPAFVKEILSEFDSIQDYLINSGNTFVILVTDSVYSIIEIEIRYLVNVLRVVSFMPREKSIVFDGKLIQFSLSDPEYSISKNGEVVSLYAATLSNFYSKRFKDSVIISKSCFEGKHLFDCVDIQRNKMICDVRS